MRNKKSGLRQKLSTKTSLPFENCQFKDRQIRELQSQTDEAKGNVNDTRRKLLPVFGDLQSTGKFELSLKVEAKLRKRLKIKSADNRLYGVFCTGGTKPLGKCLRGRRTSVLFLVSSDWERVLKCGRKL